MWKHCGNIMETNGGNVSKIFGHMLPVKMFPFFYCKVSTERIFKKFSGFVLEIFPQCVHISEKIRKKR